MNLNLMIFLISCAKEQPSTYQLLPNWVRKTSKGCAVGSARFRSDVGKINKEKALKLATERASLGLSAWIENSCQLYLREPQQLCSPCISTNDPTLETEKEKYRKQLLSRKTVSKQKEQDDFIHVEICITEKDIQGIADEVGYAGETLNPDIEHCMKKMTANLKREPRTNSESPQLQSERR